MRKILLPVTILLSITLSAQISQPAQPASGPGGSDYAHGGVTIYDYGTNGNGEDFWLYEPNNPVPDSANVVVFCHGLGMTNPKVYGAFIKHLVRKGNIVIYPRYQRTLDLATTIASYNDSCAKGIQRALDTLKQGGHVKPRLQNYFILGHSVGGVLTADMTMLYAHYGLPKPLTAFSMQPGAATYLMSDYSSFPADVKYLIAIGENDAIVGTGPGTTIFNQTTAVPTSHKNLIHHYADSHGSPGLGASHNEPAASDNAFDNGETNFFIPFVLATEDAIDYFCYWKLQDALMDCALHNQNCDVAFGDTPLQKNMGNWSDGNPVRVLEITPAAPTSVQDIRNEISVSAFPNPSKESIQFIADGFQINSQLHFEIFDAVGRNIKSQVFSTTPCQLSTANWQKGIYFYQVKNTDDEILKTGKFSVE